MKRILLLSFLLLMAATMLFAGGRRLPDHTADGLPILRVGILDGWTGFPTKYIVDNGLDVRNGFKIEYMVFSSGAPANEAMVAGQLDCAIIGGGATVPALANLNAKMIFETNNDTVGLSLIARPNLAAARVRGHNRDFPNVLGSPETVRGLTILGPSGTLQQFCALKYLELMGLTANDVDFVSMDANQAYQAFMLGQGDIFATTNQFAFRLIQEENMVMLADLDSMNLAATAQVVASNRAFSDPVKFETLTKYIKVLAEVADIMNNDLDLATRSFMNWVSLNGGTQIESVARMIMATKPYFGVAETRERAFGRDLLNNFVEFFIMTGQIEAARRQQIADNVRLDVLRAAGFK
jgi:NitT/TauT family transport system substrate-binding protein